MSILTKKQKRLVKELERLYSLLSMDFYNIKAYPKQTRTVRLELMQRAAVRQKVVSMYTLIDEYLASELCVHFFGTKRTFIQLWKTRKFALFNAHFIEELSLMPKFRYVKALKTIPKAIAADIERLNALRNAVAHSFFPENVKKSQAKWKGQSILTYAGIERFSQDLGAVRAFFERMSRNHY
jgi:uncharacterized protein YutE (UPF0331/DUF86 family)